MMTLVTTKRIVSQKEPQKIGSLRTSLRKLSKPMNAPFWSGLAKLRSVIAV